MASFPPREYSLANGQRVLIRAAVEADAEAVRTTVTEYIRENEGQVWEPGEFAPSIEDERKWIAGILADPAEILLLAVVDGAIIGNIDFHVGKRRRLAHAGEFGMGILPEWRGRGLGSLLLARMLEWAQEIPSLEKISLRVRADNPRAIALYEKHGFVREGLKRGEFKHARSEGGRYVDEIHMSKWLPGKGPRGPASS